MNASPRLLLVIAIAAAFGSCSSLSAGKGTSSGTAEVSAGEEKLARPMLEQGMSAEEIVKAIGRPNAVQPMRKSEGRAEVWVYRRVIDRTSMQVQTGVREVPAFVGPSSGTSMGMVTEPVWGMEHRTVYQLTRLLLFDGKLVSWTQTREVTSTFDN